MKFILTLAFFTFTMTNAFANEPTDIKRACDALSKKLETPSLPTQTIGFSINKKLMCFY